MKNFLILCFGLASLGVGFAQSGPIFISPGGGQVVIGVAEKFGGIGAVLNKDAATQAIYVATILPGHGAAKSGVLLNDIVMEVNGVPTAGKELTDVVSLIRGAVGSTVELAVVRDPNAPPLRFLIEREEIKSP